MTTAGQNLRVKCVSALEHRNVLSNKRSMTCSATNLLTDELGIWVIDLSWGLELCLKECRALLSSWMFLVAAQESYYLCQEVLVVTHVCCFQLSKHVEIQHCWDTFKCHRECKQLNQIQFPTVKKVANMCEAWPHSSTPQQVCFCVVAD